MAATDTTWRCQRILLSPGTVLSSAAETSSHIIFVPDRRYHYSSDYRGFSTIGLTSIDAADNSASNIHFQTPSCVDHFSSPCFSYC